MRLYDYTFYRSILSKCYFVKAFFTRTAHALLADGKEEVISRQVVKQEGQINHLH